MKNWRFSTNISRYFKNSTRYIRQLQWKMNIYNGALNDSLISRSRQYSTLHMPVGTRYRHVFRATMDNYAGPISNDLEP